MKTKIKMLLGMFVGMFGYCMLTFAQPSLEEQKVKDSMCKIMFCIMGAGLLLSSLKKIIPVNLPDGELCMKKRRQIGNWRKRSG